MARIVMIRSKLLLVHCVAAAATLLAAAGTEAGGTSGLSYDFYRYSCPNLETIVKEAVQPIFLLDSRSPSGFLRLLFHDCQVQGCDASILLDSEGGEMLSGRNFGIRNRESIGMIKALVEVECPAVVSCADIIALAAREAVAHSGGPMISIPLGRKDSTTGSNRRADAFLPSPSMGVDGALNMFSAKGLSVEESVAILGSHTIGVGHCINIVHRLYDTKEQHQRDNMDYSFKAVLKLTCPTRVPLTNDTFVVNDLTTLIFDNQYYKDVISGCGLFIVDSGISTDPRTAPFVTRFAEDQAAFFRAFSTAFVKLSSAVENGGEGEIRRVCNRVN